MQSIEWKFILIIITFAVIGIICIIKSFRAGVIASITGIVATLIVWGFRIINQKIKVFFTGLGLDFKEIFSLILCIIITIIVFFILAFIIDFFSRRQRRR